MRVALTFDAEHPSRPHCPPGSAEAVLDILAELGIPGTFFVQGQWAKAYPATAQRIVRQGHLVGNHSLYHVRMPFLTDEGFRADVLGAGTAIREVMGVDARPWFRLPFGHGEGDQRIAGLLSELGYRHVRWNVDAGDWDPDRRPHLIEKDVVEQALAVGVEAVGLMHTWPETTVVALPGIITRLRESSAAFCTVDELDRAAS